MAKTKRPSGRPTPADTAADGASATPPPGTDLPLWLTETALRAQHLQLLTLLSWFEALAVMQNELWDEWACRWGGGVPIDA